VELGAIFLLVALLLGVGLYLAEPLMGSHARRISPETQEISSLMAERDRIINALQELDFDFKLGKIPDEDYPSQRAELLQKGADILKKLDLITPAASSAGRDARSRLEKAAAARRADAATRADPISDDEIESMLAARRKARKAKSAGFCPRCGKPVSAADQFCPNCGKALK
jgi:rubrerythrin